MVTVEAQVVWEEEVYTITVQAPDAVRAVNQVLKAREELLAGLKKEEE